MGGGAQEREIRQLQKAKEKAQQKGDLKEEAALCNQLGEILARHGRFQEALEEHRQELRLLESVEDVIGRAVAHRKIGECLAELESYEAALKHQRRHLELARSLANRIEQQRAWATIGRTYMFMAESDQSSKALQEAEKAFMKSLAVLEEALEGEVPLRELSEMRARLYLNLGLVYDGLKDPAKHGYYIKKSIYISEQAHLHEDLYRAYFNLGNIHLREGEHSKAMRCLERARECAGKMKEKYLESECCASIAQVLLSLGDLVAAKRSLKKAYLLGSLQPRQRESICRSLHYVTKASRLQQALEEAEAAGNLQTALGLCEQLGDFFSKAGDYQRSVEAYEKQLCHAQALKCPAPELAVIHVSLAATFGDLKDYARAVQHYREELRLRQGNPLEEGKTWLNIALAKLETRESYEKLESCFQTALQCAEKAHDPKLQCRILQHFHACQQRWGRPEAAGTLARLRELRQSQGWHSDGEASEEEEEEEEAQSSEPWEESDLELSESDGEEDMEGCSKSIPSRRRLHKWNQRNDRGETLLHRACIEGNVRRVRFFVEKGHPLNPRDYCGWTPLHEACNHGHLEVVRLLLDHGATIDDPGGPGCEGITPLHDALNCGHFDVAELLVERGASVLLHNAKGLSPLGTLQEWVRLYGRDLDRETRQRCKTMEGLLRKAMAGRGSKSQAPREQLAAQLFDAEFAEAEASGPPGPALPPPSPRRAPSLSGKGEPSLGHPEPEGDCMAPLRPVKKRQRLLGQRRARDEGKPAPQEAEPAAPAEYRAAIRGLGSAWSRIPASPQHLAPADGPALIPPEEYVGDDWLEDDLGQSWGGRKRSRPSEEEESESEPEASPEPQSNRGGPCQPPEAARRRRPRNRQSRLTQIVDRTPLGKTAGASVVDGPAGPEPGSLGGSGNGSRVDGEAGGGASPPRGLAQPPAPPPPIRVRVQVQDNVFLIPVPHSGSSESPRVSWLAEQAAQRHYQTCGLLPRLTLKKEGALLAPQDLIGDVLQSNEEVLAEVESWDLPPLAERYRKACRSLAVGEHQLLLKTLGRQEAGPSFSASGLALRRRHLTPLLRALKLQTSLRRLSLSGTGLGDDAAGELLACLLTLPGLKRLDLSANQLGPEGLRQLAVGLSGSPALQHLEELDLSLNPLGNSSGQSLASLLQACPVLSTLSLQACSLTPASLQHYRLLLASALKGAVHLQRLTVSHNALGSAGLELLLTSLPCETLTHLEISSVSARAGDQQPLRDAVVSYLLQEGCALTHLALSGNHVDDAAVAELARCLPICLPLVSLDLAANPEISIVGLRMLLLALEERKRGLQFLSLAGCAVKGPLDGVTWAKLSANVRQLLLCSHHLSRSDQRDVAELWPSPAGASLHSLTRHHKLFCQCVQ
ncbi:tonsoku-like protein [Hemicordylus capensis]|uniref:tonsoku-like protein n=1 Tax=Hemicordylus capensis TaxID=884348 RepID=UPI002302E6F7|nr:tonsoku-like protein [Hemicordylus capensis]